MLTSFTRSCKVYPSIKPFVPTKEQRMIEEDNVFFDLCPYYYLSEPTTAERGSPANRAIEYNCLPCEKKNVDPTTHYNCQSHVQAMVDRGFSCDTVTYWICPYKDCHRRVFVIRIRLDQHLQTVHKTSMHRLSLSMRPELAHTRLKHYEVSALYWQLFTCKLVPDKTYYRGSVNSPVFPAQGSTQSQSNRIARAILRSYGSKLEDSICNHALFAPADVELIFKVISDGLTAEQTQSSDSGEDSVVTFSAEDVELIYKVISSSV